MTSPPLSYRLASGALALPIAVYTLYRAWRDGGWRYLTQRYGHIENQPAGLVWLHCASVGEVSAALPLVTALDRAGVGPLLVTTNTPTGQYQAHAHVPPGTRVAYLPVDRPRAVARFLARVTPRVALILETELWPYVFAGLTARGVPIALVNARLSERSTQAPAWWRHTAAWCLTQADLILARSEADRTGFARLGAPVERLHVAGNLKHATPIGPPPERIELGRSFVLAASTHHDEEEQLARALRAHGNQNALWVIAPRHPVRGRAIRRQLRALGWNVTQRSLGEAVPDGPGFYVADTLGELPSLMEASQLIVMGGSLIPHGGQNVIEAARAGRPTITGPHMENFADETAGLSASGALIQAENADQLVTVVETLLADEDRRSEMAAAARAWSDGRTDPALRYRQWVEALLSDHNNRPPDTSASVS